LNKVNYSSKTQLHLIVWCMVISPIYPHRICCRWCLLDRSQSACRAEQKNSAHVGNQTLILRSLNLKSVAIQMEPSCLQLYYLNINIYKSSWNTNLNYSASKQLCRRISIYILHVSKQPITVAMQSKAWSVFTHSNGGIVGLNPLKVWMTLCDYSVFVLFCVKVVALWLADPCPRSPTSCV
jgi:hypothetical protein